MLTNILVLLILRSTFFATFLSSPTLRTSRGDDIIFTLIEVCTIKVKSLNFSLNQTTLNLSYLLHYEVVDNQ